MNNKYIKGFDEADAVLRDLPQSVENRVLQRATSRGAAVWRKALRSAAPRHGKGKQSKNSIKYRPLVRNIRSFVLKSLKRIRGRRGARVSTGDAFWGLFLEFGTSRQPARPWFRSTIEENVQAVEQVLKQELAAGIEHEAKKLADKAGVR